MQSQILPEIFSNKERFQNIDPRAVLLLFVFYVLSLYPASLVRPVGIIALIVIPAFIVYLALLPARRIIGIIGKIYPVVAIVSFFQIVPFLTISHGYLEWTGIEQPVDVWIRVFDIQAKSLLLITAGIILMISLPFTSILQAFRSLRFPQTLISVMFFIYRFVFIMLREVSRLAIAYRSRYVKLSIWQRISMVGKMTAVLITRIFNFQENMFQALVNRGFNGEFIFEKHLNWRSRDTIMVLAGFSALILIGFWL